MKFYQLNKKIHINEEKLPIDDKDDKWLEEPIEEEYTPVSPKNLPESVVNWVSNLIKSFIVEKDIEKETGRKPKASSVKVEEVHNMFDDDFDMD